MTKLSKIVSATIVAFFANSALWAAPQDDVPDSSPGREITEPKKQDENMAVSEPPNTDTSSTRPNIEYFSHRQTLTFRLGGASPADDLNDSETLLGFAYMFPKFLSPRFEAGADVHNKDDKGHVHAGIRKIYFERGRVRPGYKYGLSHEVHAEEGLASFANNKHYFGRVSGTVDVSYDVDWAVRVEIEGLIGIKKQWLMASVGLSRCW